MKYGWLNGWRLAALWRIVGVISAQISLKAWPVSR
jgi:hypothetical protein